MSNVRFTNDILSRQTLFDLGNITDTLAKTQNELSTGKRIQQPEDDPYGAGRAVSLRNQLADVQQYQTNINDASAWAQTTDSALGNVTDLLQRARELVVQAANGTQDQTLARRDLGRDDADQGVAAGAGERDVQRPLHLLGHGDERRAVPVQRLLGHHAARAAPDRRPARSSRSTRTGRRRSASSRPARRRPRTCSTCSTTSSGTSTPGTTPRCGSSALTELDGVVHDGGQRADHGRCDLQPPRDPGATC